MKLRFVPISNAVQDFIQDTGISAGTDESVLLKWATDAVSMLTFDQQLQHKIKLLQVYNASADLPDDYRILVQAAANVFPRTSCDCERDPNDPCCHGRNSHQKTRVEKVVQWTQDAFEDDCEITIDLNCPKCGSGSCNCSDRVIEVDVDRIWELSHPEYYHNYTRFGQAHRIGEGGGMYSAYHPKFEIMRYTQSPYHRVTQILPGCINTQCPGCTTEFSIDNGVLQVDFTEGEVLLSYLGEHLDADQNKMIPDHPKVHQAVLHYLTYKYFLREYFKGNDKAARRYAVAMDMYNEAIASAISAIDTPDFHEFKSWMEDNWFQRVPKKHLDHNNGNTDIARAMNQRIDGSTGTRPRTHPDGWNNSI